MEVLLEEEEIGWKPFILASDRQWNINVTLDLLIHCSSSPSGGFDVSAHCFCRTSNKHTKQSNKEEEEETKNRKHERNPIKLINWSGMANLRNQFPIWSHMMGINYADRHDAGGLQFLVRPFEETNRMPMHYSIKSIPYHRPDDPPILYFQRFYLDWFFLLPLSICGRFQSSDVLCIPFPHCLQCAMRAMMMMVCLPGDLCEPSVCHSSHNIAHQTPPNSRLCLCYECW